MSLYCKLVPVQYRDFLYGPLHGLMSDQPTNDRPTDLPTNNLWHNGILVSDFSDELGPLRSNISLPHPLSLVSLHHDLARLHTLLNFIPGSNNIALLTHWEISDKSRAVPECVAAVVPACRHPYSTAQHWSSRGLGSWSSPRICQSGWNALLPADYKMTKNNIKTNYDTKSSSSSF